MELSDSHVLPEDSYRQKTGTLSSHGQLLRFLDQCSRETRILDVGTAAGYFGAALQQRGFRHVSGIESDADLAAQARPSYETVAVSDLEQDELPWPAASFDVVVCADVLEHLRDPAAILCKLTRLIVPSGWILVSLPNVAHWSVRLSLLAGQFNYVSSGILDRSHLRFYTRATARRLVRSAGLEVRREGPTPLPIAHWCDGSWLTPLWRTLERVDWLLARLWPTLFAYQFILFSQRSEETRVS